MEEKDHSVEIDHIDEVVGTEVADHLANKRAADPLPDQQASGELQERTQPPEPFYRLPYQQMPAKGGIPVKKTVSLKVADLLQAGRSHFEIPMSQQIARKKVQQPPRRG